MKKYIGIWASIGLIPLLLTGCSSNHKKVQIKSNHGSTSHVTNSTNAAATNNQTTNSTRSTSSPASPMHYTLYKNAKFSFSVRVPSEFKKQPPPTNHDGATWTYQNAVKITVSGSNNTTKDTVSSVLHNLVQKEAPTYKQHGTDWLVVSGINKQNDIYYTKRYIGESKEYGLTIQYPKSDKQKYQQMVTTVANSFHPGPMKSLGSVSYKITQTKKLRSSTDKYSTYTNKSYHFSLQYPSNWTESPKPTDQDGRVFYVNTQDKQFSNLLGSSSLASSRHDAVIQAVGTFNPINVTYQSVKNRPNKKGLLSYKVTKIANGYELREEQKKGDTMIYKIQVFNKKYLNTLNIIVPANSSHYKTIAQKVLASYRFSG